MVSKIRVVKHPLKRLVEIRVVISEETYKEARQYCIQRGLWDDRCLENIIQAGLKTLKQQGG